MADTTPNPDNLNNPGAGDSSYDSGSQALSSALSSSFAIVRVVMVILLIVFLGSGFFKVGPEEQAIVLRLGRPVGTGAEALLGPGPHFSWPYPIDEHVKVSIARVQSVTSTVGWFATTPAIEAAGSEPVAGPTLNPAVDGYALTADGNIIHVRATLTYRITDPIGFVFNFANASNAIQTTLDDAMLAATASFNVDDILTRDVIGFNEAVRKRVTDLVSQRKLGIVVEQCSVRSIPPRQLKEAFANVLKAEVKRSQVLSEARSYENQVTSKASADAQSRINTARSDRVRVITEVASRADQFQELLPKYRGNPSLFVQQRLTETLGRVFTNAQDKIFVSEAADGQTRELRLLLNREAVKPKTEEPKP